jgi:hypothetical protein
MKLGAYPTFFEFFYWHTCLSRAAEEPEFTKPELSLTQRRSDMGSQALWALLKE